MTRLLALGDLHLQKGETLHFGRLAEQEQVLDRILTAARDENVDAVLLAGDLFDRRRPSPEALLTAERPLVRHREHDGPKVIAIPGNHDLIDLDTDCGLDVLAETGLLELHRQHGATVVGDTTVACLPWAPVSRLRAQLGDVSADEVNQACADLLVTVAAELHSSISGPSVLIAHWAVDAAVLPSGMSVADLREVVLPLGDLQALGYDAVILAHIHRQQTLSNHPLVAYVGSPMPLDFGEVGLEHGYLLLDDAGPRFVPVASPRFLTFDSLDHAAASDVTDAYVRVRVTSDGTDNLDARELERCLIDDGARYARVDVIVERAVRARVDVAEDVTDEQAFDLWLAANEIETEIAAGLRVLDQHYRGQVAA